MTSLLQPCDVVWNKPLMDRQREKWNAQMANGKEQWKCASYDMVAKGVVES